MSRIDDVTKELSSLHLQIKHDLEQAEAKAESASRLIEELGATGLLDDTIVFGPHFERPYDHEDGPDEIGQIVQAALLLPQGIGVCLWDAAEFSAWQQSPDQLERHARDAFRPFEKCSSAEKRFLLPFVEDMLEDLTDVALVAASKKEEGPSVSAEDYFRQRMGDDDRMPQQ